ncbi:MAG: Ldh family oxidoreductase [Burkholderiales bacterium]
MSAHTPSRDVQRLTLDEVRTLASDALRAHGVEFDVAALLADRIVLAERDGPASHGLFMLPSLLSGLRCGWIGARARPRMTVAGPAALHVDGDNGFAQPGLERARPELARMAAAQGIAVLTQRNAHHVGALRCDVEPFAEAGLVAMMFVATRRRVVPHGGRHPMLGTNPMAFAAPVRGRPPFVWDMATSAVAVSDVRLMAESGRAVPPGTGVDRHGAPTTDARSILDGGALLAFGGHKGTAVSLMVEIMAAALSGGRFAVEDRAAEVPGAASANGGQTVIVIDPARAGDAGLAGRVADWLALYPDTGAERLPGDGRLARRDAAVRDGVDVPTALLRQLREAGRAP